MTNSSPPRAGFLTQTFLKLQHEKSGCQMGAFDTGYGGFVALDEPHHGSYGIAILDPSRSRLQACRKRYGARTPLPSRKLGRDGRLAEESAVESFATPHCNSNCRTWN